MNDAVNFNGSAMDHIKYKVRFDDKHSIPGAFERVIFRDPAKEWMCLKTANTVIELFNKGCSVRVAVPCYPVEDADKVVNSNRKVTEGVSICHASVAEVFSPPGYA